MFLEALISGVIGPGVTHLAGPAGSGKTTVAMQCAIAIARRGGLVAWLDTTNGFSLKRFRLLSMAAGCVDAGKNVFRARPKSAEGIDHALDNLRCLIARRRVALVVIDSMFGCLDIRNRDPNKRHLALDHAGMLVSRLHLLSRLAGTPILVTNEVSHDPNIGRDTPVLYRLLSSCQVVQVQFTREISENSDGETRRFFYRVDSTRPGCGGEVGDARGTIQEMNGGPFIVGRDGIVFP